MTEVWLGQAILSAWDPRCEIVIHSTRSRYLRAVGGAGAQTFGSSFVRSHKGRIASRRIDLVADSHGELSALAHELTHIVLADRFAGRQPPRWLDEGIALLSDSPRKQSLHQRDCRAALESGTALRLAEVFTLEDFSSAHQVASFYGQSHSIVQFLAAQDEPSTLLSFIEVAMDRGYAQALSQHYSIESVTQLERRWRSYATTASTTAAPGLLISTGH